MALLPQKIEDIKERFEVVVPHKNLKSDEVIEKGKKEYLELRQSLAKGVPSGKPLRVCRGSTYGYRFDYMANMYDIHSLMRKFYLTIKPRPRIPRVPHGIRPLNVMEEPMQGGGSRVISCLERCRVNGVIPRALELRSSEQAIYVFGCMADGQPINLELFNDKEQYGKHIEELKAEDEARLKAEADQYPTTDTTAPVQYSTTELPERLKLPKSPSVGYQLTIPNSDGSPFKYPTTGRVAHPQHPTTDNALDLIPPIHEEVTTHLNPIHEAVIRIERKVNSVGSADWSGVEQAVIDLLESTRNEFEKGILLNKKGEEFIIMLFDFIEETMKGNGNNKTDAVRQAKLSMDDERTTFNSLKLAFTKCKLGANKGKDVTEYDILEYFNRTFYTPYVPAPDGGDPVRRVLKKY